MITTLSEQAWPKELRDDIATLTSTDRDHVWSMLKPVDYPDDHPEPPKMTAMKKIATELVADIEDLQVDGIFKK